MVSNPDLVVSEDRILEACGPTPMPEVGIIEQVCETEPIPRDEISDRAKDEIARLDTGGIPPGGEIAVGVGSRGIANLPELVEGVIRELKECGFSPFVFPAMGSHGGATAEGQREMLASLGVTESAIGCEIRSSMAVTQVSTTQEREVPVYADAGAVAADGIVVINRIKPHTDYNGDVESGLSKMLVIGMGKQRGAKIAHEWAIDWSFRNMIPEITSQLLEELPVIGGIGVVEDQYDDTAIIEGIPPDGFLEREAELLEMAYDIMPTLPFDEIDVLVLDRQGKDISGQGLDTNVIGRRPFAINEPSPKRPRIKRIFVRSLTPTTHGNAMGMGSADFVHRDLVESLDSSVTLVNAITASTIRGVRLPPVVETDRAGVVASVSTGGVVNPGELRLLRAPDTMHLSRLYASTTLVQAARGREDLRVIREPAPLEFRDDGAFADPSLLAS